MATMAAELFVKVGADTSEAERGLDRVEKRTKALPGVVRSAMGAVGKVGALLGGFGLAANGVQALGSAFTGAGRALGIDFNAKLEQAQIGFTTMLGSGEKARSFLGELQSFAAKTPFEFPELVTNAQKMLAMGTSAEQVIPRLTAIGDAVAALGGGSEMVGRVTTALGQMGAKGKVSAEEMLQLTEAGIPAWQMLADKIGVSVPEAMKLAEKGAISADTAIAAITAGMNERFGGMMAAQSKTFSGAMSTIKDSVNIALGTAFRPLFDTISRGSVTLAEFLSGERFAGWSAQASAALGQFGSLLASALPHVAAFGDALLDRAVPAVQQLGEWITGTLAPALRDFWGDDVLPKVQQFAGILTGQLLPAVQQLGGQLAGVLGPALTSSIGWLADHKEVLGGVAITVGGALTAAFAAWAVSAGAAAAATIAATAPVLLIGAAVAGLATGIILLVKHWDEITAKFPILGSAAELAGAIVEHFAERLTNLGGALAEVAGAIIDADIPGKLGAAFDFIKDVDLGQKIRDANWGEQIVAAVTEAFAGLREKGAELLSGLWQGVQSGWDGGVSFLTDLGQSALDAVGDLASTLTEAGSNLLTGLWDGAQGVWDRVSGWLGQRGGDAAAAVGDLAGTLLGHGRALLTGAWDGARAVWTEVSGWLAARGADAAAVVGDLAGTLLGAGRALLGGLIAGAREVWSREVAFFSSLGSTIVGAVGDLSGLLAGAGRAVIQGFISGVRSMLGELRSVFAEITALIPRVKGPLTKDAVLLYPAGQAVMDGLIGGVESRVPALERSLQGVTDAIVEATQARLGIRSPSQVMADQVGAPLSQGIAQGMIDALPAVQGAVDQTARILAGIYGSTGIHQLIVGASYGDPALMGPALQQLRRLAEEEQEEQRVRLERIGQATGAALGAGLSAGLQRSGQRASDMFEELIRRLIERLRALLGIRSPSQVAAEQIGEPIGQGIAQGIANSAPAIQQAIVDATRVQPATWGPTTDQQAIEAEFARSITHNNARGNFQPVAAPPAEAFYGPAQGRMFTTLGRGGAWGEAALSPADRFALMAGVVEALKKQIAAGDLLRPRPTPAPPTGYGGGVVDAGSFGGRDQEQPRQGVTIVNNFGKVDAPQKVVRQIRSSLWQASERYGLEPV